MPIIVNLDVVLAKRKMKSVELAKLIGITEQNLSILKTGKAKPIRISTLEAICKHLDCQPGDILEYKNQEQSAVNKRFYSRSVYAGAFSSIWVVRPLGQGVEPREQFDTVNDMFKNTPQKGLKGHFG